MRYLACVCLLVTLSLGGSAHAGKDAGEKKSDKKEDKSKKGGDGKSPQDKTNDADQKNTP